MPQTKDFKAFPIDSKQLHYLIVNDYVDFPNVDTDHVRDKDKVDGLLRIFTLLQTGWFVVNIILRASQRLYISTLELTTAAFILCTFGTTICAFHKPDGVRKPDVLYSRAKLRDIMAAEKRPIGAMYQRTPLDFISRREYSLSKYWAHWFNTFRFLGLDFLQPERPVERFANANNLAFYGIRGLPYWMLLFISSAYFGVFIAGWNFTFPTSIEQTLWRVASLFQMGTMWAFTIITELAFFDCIPPESHSRSMSATVAKVPDVPDVEEQKGPRCMRNAFERFVHSLASSIRNNTVSKDPDLDIPISVVFSIDFCAFVYGVARLYIWVADFIELRSLPHSSFTDVDFSRIVPHL